MVGIFDPDSRFSHIMGAVFDYAKLGLLALVLCLPVVTAGAGIIAAMCVGMKVARGEEPTLWKPFKRSFRENFRQSLPLTLLVLTLPAVLIRYMSVVCARTFARSEARTGEDDGGE